MIPPRPLYLAGWALHRALFRATGGRVGTTRPGGDGGLGTLFLETTGRTSGKRRGTALFYLDDGRNLAVVASNAGADRSSLLIAFGGGIVGDAGGFLAAIYMRGIPYVQVPTTLLAQVDSSVGGKTGVNLTSGKNLIGSFHQPLAVFADVHVLKTLPPRELRAGLFESVKAGIIRDPSLFRFLETNCDRILDGDPAALQRVVTSSVAMKAEVVSIDERESGLRMILNFGHTLGHAIEAVTGYKKLLHGEAIAWGMLAALHLSLTRGRITRQHFDRMSACILRYGPIPPFKADPAKLVALTYGDKKKRSGRRAFVLATGIGTTEIAYDVTDEELLTATRAMFSQMEADRR